MVITDGYFSTAGNLSNTALQQAVSLLNSEGVVVFFFSLGPGDGDNPPNPLTELRKFSCLLNSTVTYVSTEDAVRNPLWAIRPYFDYQATMRFKENVTFWTDIYGNGQGNVSTVSYPGTCFVSWLYKAWFFFAPSYSLYPSSLVGPKVDHRYWHLCAVFKNGTLYGVASINVPVNYTDENIIKQKYVDPNVPAISLTCQMQQARLFSCY